MESEADVVMICLGLDEANNSIEFDETKFVTDYVLFIAKLRENLNNPEIHILRTPPLYSGTDFNQTLINEEMGRIMPLIAIDVGLDPETSHYIDLFECNGGAELDSLELYCDTGLCDGVFLNEAGASNIASCVYQAAFT